MLTYEIQAYDLDTITKFRLVQNDIKTKVVSKCDQIAELDQ